MYIEDASKEASFFLYRAVTCMVTIGY